MPRRPDVRPKLRCEKCKRVYDQKHFKKHLADSHQLDPVRLEEVLEECKLNAKAWTHYAVTYEDELKRSMRGIDGSVWRDVLVRFGKVTGLILRKGKRDYSVKRDLHERDEYTDSSEGNDDDDSTAGHNNDQSSSSEEPVASALRPVLPGRWNRSMRATEKALTRRLGSVRGAVLSPRKNLTERAVRAMKRNAFREAALWSETKGPAAVRNSSPTSANPTEEPPTARTPSPDPAKPPEDTAPEEYCDSSEDSAAPEEYCDRSEDSAPEEYCDSSDIYEKLDSLFESDSEIYDTLDYVEDHHDSSGLSDADRGPSDQDIFID